jgi:hypothetical protein
MDAELKTEMLAFFNDFWNYEPQPSFPSMVEEFKEQGIDIRRRPNVDDFRNRNKKTISCPHCGRPVGCPSDPYFGMTADEEHAARCKELGMPNVRFVSAD